MDMAKIVLAVVETTPTVAMKIAQGGLFMDWQKSGCTMGLDIRWAICSRPAPAQILTPRLFMWVRI
jgi:hypothetical protein